MTPPDLADVVRYDQGVVSARIFSDPDIYQLELERLFPRCWLFVAADSEIPQPGDFVTRSMGADPVIVSRDEHGKVHVLLNVCRHRGRKVCNDDCGNVNRFTCGYHGWTYSAAGKLTGLPFADAYQGALNKDELGLLQAEVDSYHGLIFAAWQPNETLKDYLGPMAWVLDLTFGRSDAVEVAGPPIRWQADANWKLGASNFVGDGHHIFTTHGFSTQLGLHGLKPRGSTGQPVGHSLAMSHGHGASLVSAPSGSGQAPYCALPEELWPELERHLDEQQRRVLEPLVVIAGNVFPNLSLLETAGHTPEEWGGPDMPISFLTLRQWQPAGPRSLEGLSWVFVDRNAPAEWKKLSRECYERVFGVSGTFEQDDLENWAQITAGTGSPRGRKLWLQYKMGLNLEPTTDWAGPGTCYSARPPFFDILERLFFQQWREVLQEKG
jgi:PAH dioxygenase large subunit